MNLSTRQLRAFVAAADHGNFTRAAADIGLSQPAFSALVKSLEEELGAQLFVRNTRNVSLTPFGRLFDAFARRTLFETDTALRDLRDYATGRVGKVHVAALPSIAANWLPSVLRRFRGEYPAVTTAVSDGMSQQCVELLTHGEIDFALATTDHYAPDLRRELLWTDRFHLVCPRGHPLATTRKPVTLEQIARYPFINFVKHSSVRQLLDTAFARLELNNVLELEHLATVSAMVENNVGITVVPTLTLYQFQRPELVIRDLGGPPLTREIYILSRKNKELSMPAQALHDLLLAHVGALGRDGKPPGSD